MSTKRTYRPSRLKRQRRLGFRARMSCRHGRNIVKRRRLKGRKKITA